MPIIVGLVVFVVGGIIIILIIVFISKKCGQRRQRLGGQNEDGRPDDSPGPDENYDAGMQQRMDEWAAIRRRLPPKPFDKPGNRENPIIRANAEGRATLDPGKHISF
jgi:hypothetical protein